MSISFNIKVDKKIVHNGQEYSSIDQLPEGARQALGKAMGIDGSAVIKSSDLKIVFNGREYGSIDAMPSEEKRVYAQAITLAGDSKILSGGAATEDVVNLLKTCDTRPGFVKWLIPRRLIQWTEPQEIKDVRYATQKRNFTRFLPAILIALFAGIFLLGKMKPEMDVNILYYTVLAVAGIVFLIIYMSRVTRTTIYITDKAIVMNCGDNSNYWIFNQIDHCEIATMNTGASAHSALMLHTKSGHKKIIGIDPVVQLKDLRLVLESKGVNVR